ncbi:MAG: DNA topoisomerase III, partial [Betaproteobacteria bacterium]|nr:DNA topoisomerase III [Betaproteobacteria bacterium]
VRESHRRFACGACEFFIWKAVAGREFSAAEADLLLSGKKTALLEGFRSKMGREFSAEMVLKKDENGAWRAAFDFGEPAAAATLEELKQKEEVGACPKCGAPVRNAGGAYVCEKKAEDACDFVLARRLLQREMLPEEVKMLLGEGKTKMLEGFVSQKTRRPFSARLTFDLAAKNGKLGFEFTPRKTAAKRFAKKPAKKPAAK